MDDILGNIFGNWLVLSKHNNGNKYSYKYVCECQCDKKTVKILDKNRLVHGKTIDCGCSREKDKTKKYLSHVGEKYNKLTITKFIGRVDDLKSTCMFYECKCDCGSDKIVRVPLYELKNNRQKSCGLCIEMSDDTKKKISQSKKKENRFIEHDDFIEGVDCNGHSFLFDKDDFDKVRNIDKYISLRNSGYIFICDKKNGDWQFHRFIMDIDRYNYEDMIIVDHINGDKADNRKRNLRVCHKSKNPMNAKTYKNNTSGHKGVSWIERLSKWQATIYCNKTNIYLGVYSNLQEAIDVRKTAEIKYFGEYSRDYSSSTKEG